MDLFEISERTNLFQLILMVSLGKKSHDDIVKHLQMTELDYPVYIDDENAFRKLNPAIPDDPQYDCEALHPTDPNKDSFRPYSIWWD